MFQHQIDDAALHLWTKLGSPQGVLSISSFHERSGDVVLVVHVNNRHGYLCDQIPSVWEGLPVRCQVSEMPAASCG